MTQTDDTVIVALHAAPMRLAFALLVFGGLGVILIYLSFTSSGGAAAKAFLLVLGLFVFFAGYLLKRAAEGALLLTTSGLETQDRVLLVPWEEMVAVDRGALAIKPSNGFTVKTKSPMRRGWALGLWWCVGRRFGVGGVASAGAAKFMAERIAMRLKDQA